MIIFYLKLVGQYHQCFDTLAHVGGEASGSVDFRERQPPNAVEKVVGLSLSKQGQNIGLDRTILTPDELFGLEQVAALFGMQEVSSQQVNTLKVLGKPANENK